ncbi:hypothetical protein ACVIM9_005891 [Bradyrhizobium sp. USDA 4520]
MPTSRREIWPGIFKMSCAMPISTISAPGASSACTRSGGKLVPLASGRSPSLRPRSRSVSPATSISPGGVTKDCRLPRPTVGALPTSDGSVTGSIPSRRKLRPSIWTRPSSIGDTGQPARRRSTNNACGKVALSLATSIAVRDPPKVAAARS